MKRRSPARREGENTADVTKSWLASKGEAKPNLRYIWGLFVAIYIDRMSVSKPGRWWYRTSCEYIVTST
jgi:hypothetical protein